MENVPGRCLFRGRCVIREKRRDGKVGGDGNSARIPFPTLSSLEARFLFDKRPPDLHQTPRRDPQPPHPNPRRRRRDDNDSSPPNDNTRGPRGGEASKPHQGPAAGCLTPPSATGNGAPPLDDLSPARSARGPHARGDGEQGFRPSILHGGAGFSERTDTVETFPNRRDETTRMARLREKKKQWRWKKPNHSIVDHDGDFPNGMCFASRHSRHRYSSATGQATGVVVREKTDDDNSGNIGTIPHPLTVGLVSASPRQTHAPQLFFGALAPKQTAHPSPQRNGKKDMGGGRASRPGTLVPGCSTFDATSLKTCISALRCAFPPSSRRTARPPPSLACSPTNQQSQDHPHRHHWLFFPSCPSNGSVLELGILTHSMPETTGFV